MSALPLSMLLNEEPLNPQVLFPKNVQLPRLPELTVNSLKPLQWPCTPVSAVPSPRDQHVPSRRGSVISSASSSFPIASPAIVSPVPNSTNPQLRDSVMEALTLRHPDMQKLMTLHCASSLLALQSPLSSSESTWPDDAQGLMSRYARLLVACRGQLQEADRRFSIYIRKRLALYEEKPTREQVQVEQSQPQRTVSPIAVPAAAVSNSIVQNHVSINDVFAQRPSLIPSSVKQPSSPTDSCPIRRPNYPRGVTATLTLWLMDHVDQPFPDPRAKAQLRAATGLDPTQLNNWFINARRRLVRRLMAWRDAGAHVRLAAWRQVCEVEAKSFAQSRHRSLQQWIKQTQAELPRAVVESDEESHVMICT